MSAQDAAEKSLSYMADRVNGSGGVIVVSSHGDIAKHFTTERMAWASAKDGILQFGLDPEEINTIKL